jgi:hypothetical protein
MRKLLRRRGREHVSQGVEHDRVAEVELPGSENGELRKVVRAAIEFAQATKHRRNGDRCSARKAADEILLVVNLVR